MRNKISKLYNSVSPPAAETRDTLAQTLQSVRETAFLLYNRMIYRVWKKDIEIHRRKRSKGRKRRNYRIRAVST